MKKTRGYNNENVVYNYQDEDISNKLMCDSNSLFRKFRQKIINVYTFDLTCTQ